MMGSCRKIGRRLLAGPQVSMLALLALGAAPALAQNANPGTDQKSDMAYNLRLRIEKDGKITVINERNGFNKTYGGN